MKSSSRLFTNLFIIILVSAAFGVGIFEKFISPGFSEEGFKDHPLFKDDTRNVRDQDFWPFSSYPMFSDGYDKPQVSRIEARGITFDDKEVVLQISRVFYPLWENGLHRMLKKATVHHKETGPILDALSNLFLERFQNESTPQYARNLYPPIKKINWYVQLWEWESWVNLRKSGSNLDEWQDYKSTQFRPQYQHLFHSSPLAL